MCGRCSTTAHPPHSRKADAAEADAEAEADADCRQSGKQSASAVAGSGLVRDVLKCEVHAVRGPPSRRLLNERYIGPTLISEVQ